MALDVPDMNQVLIQRGESQPASGLRVRLVHCGNRNPADPADSAEKNVFFMPMGIFGLAGVLRDAGCEVKIVHGDLEEPGLAGALDPLALDAVGLDLHWLNQSLTVLETAAMLKQRNPRLFIFLGGFTASYFAMEIIRDHPQVDAVIRGDAELPAAQLCQALHAGHGLAQVANLVWRDPAGKVVSNEFSYVAGAEDLEFLDFACFELLHHADLYLKRSIYWTHVAPANFAPLNFSPMLLLEVGRGCQNRCLFCGGSCSAQQLINHRQAQVWRSPQSAMATIAKAVKQHGYRTIFTDFEFPDAEEWYLELFALIRESGLELDYAYSSWRLVSPRLIQALSATFRRAWIQFSPETADEALRDRNKGGNGYNNAELEAALTEVASTENVTAQLYFGYFLAGDSAAAVNATLDYILQLLTRFQEKLGIAYLPFSTDPGSELQRHPDRHQVTMEPANFAEYLACLRREYRNPGGVGRQQPDLRLFRPLSLGLEEARALEERIELLNLAFAIHRPTLSRLLRQAGGAERLSESLRRATGGSGIEAAGRLVSAAIGAGHEQQLQQELARYRLARPGFSARPMLWLQSNAMENGVGEY